jgi:hypothetical protein
VNIQTTLDTTPEIERLFADWRRAVEKAAENVSAQNVTLLCIPPKYAKHSRGWRIHGMTKRQWRRVRHLATMHTFDDVYLERCPEFTESGMVNVAFSYESMSSRQMRS